MLILSLIFLGVFANISSGLEPEVINQWNLFTFDFPAYGWAENFRPDRTFFTGLAVGEDRIFLAMPRIYSGVPATLAFIPRFTPSGSSPPLRAYPDWSWHEAGRNGTVNATCEFQIISVYRIKIDSCNRLWVLDSGIMTSLEDFRRICQPKILVFDLNTNHIVRTIIFPREVLRPSSLLTNLVIDEAVQGSCDASFLYISDTVVPGLVVYDSRTDTSWRFVDPAMYPDPDFGVSTIAGESFSLMDGIVGLAHSPSTGVLYFQPYATNRVFSVPTAALRRGPLTEVESLPISVVGTKSSQGVGLALDPRDETLYFAPVSETSVGSWNPLTNQQRLVAFDPLRLQFTAEILWAHNDNGNLWLLSSRFQKFFRRSIRSTEVNLRILRINLSPAQLNNNILYRGRTYYKK